jgi:hypothetical protein
MSENQLISAVKQTFTEKKSKYLNTNEMERALIAKGLTPKEVMKALSLAKAKQEIGMLYPPKRELCYQLLAEEDRRHQNRLILNVKQVFDKKKSKYIKVDEMKQLLFEQNLTPDESEQAILIAKANDVIREVFPYTHEIDGEPCYELLTKEELEALDEEELHDLEEDTQIRKKEERKNKRNKKKKKEAS